MSHPTHPTPYPGPPPRKPVVHDALAVALGNASLLGIGYVLMRRWMTAIAVLLVTVALVVTLLIRKEVWCEVAVLTWWVIVIAHGWFLARRQPQQTASVGKRLIALGLTIPVLIAVGFLRYDAARIDGRVTEARDAGDCAQVTAAQDKVWFGHRVADAPRTARGDADVQACDKLQVARAELRQALEGDGDVQSLNAGFSSLREVLAAPGQDSTAGVVLDEFLQALPGGDNPCKTVLITTWLRARKPTHNTLDRSSDTVRRIEPAALVACGDAHAQVWSWQGARSMYQELLKRYPHDRLVAKARAGVALAAQKLELDAVNNLLTTVGEDGQTQYCSSPAKYTRAAPYRRGVNRALFVGDSNSYTAKLPERWTAADLADAVLVICVDGPKTGTAVRTCPYEVSLRVGTVDVTYHKIALHLRAFELRSGRLVADTTVQLGGAACPASFSYTSSSSLLPGDPPTTKWVIPSSATVRAAFSPILVRP